MSTNNQPRQGRGLRAEGRAALCSLPFALAVLVSMPLAASAQDAAETQPGGPMIVERVHSGFTAAPEVKETEFDHRASTLVGGSAGWITDETFFVGGAGYWLASDRHDRELGYGGLLFQWIGRGTESVGFGARALVGGGTSTLTDNVSYTVRVPGPVPLVNGRPDPSRVTYTNQTFSVPVRFHDDFFLVEPGLDLRFKLTSHTRLTAGVGYRLVAGERHDDSRIRGATATIGLQLGSGL